MRLEIALLVAFVAVASAYRSGYNCPRYCGTYYAPVCSTEGQTYPNECWLKCDWAYKACDGRCPCRPQPPYRPPHRPPHRPPYRPPPRPHPEPIYYEPAVSYEPPTYDCSCAPDKDYVCTYDNETYDNECEARCDGKFKACDGPCPCS